MHSSQIVDILASVRSGKVSVESALERLRHLPYEDISCAKVDHHRDLRQGIPEVILAQGKKIDEIRVIAKTLYKTSKRLLITRATRKIYDSLELKDATFYPASGIISVGSGFKEKRGSILVVSAGTRISPLQKRLPSQPRFSVAEWKRNTISGLQVCTDCWINEKNSRFRGLSLSLREWRVPCLL